MRRGNIIGRTGATEKKAQESLSNVDLNMSGSDCTVVSGVYTHAYCMITV